MEGILEKVLRIELTSYFSMNRGRVVTAEEAAEELGRGAGEIKSQFDKLAELGVVERVSLAGGEGYRYIAPSCTGLNNTRRRSKRAQEPENNGERAEETGVFEGKGSSPRDSIRLSLMIAALKENDWRACLRLLLDAIVHLEDAQGAAYLVDDHCSRIKWSCLSGAEPSRASMPAEGNHQSMVIEGELVDNGGMLDTTHFVKYLHHLEGGEAIFICVYRGGRYNMDVETIKSIMVDIMPVVAEKRRLDLASEVTVERLLQDSLYWNTVYSPSTERGVIGALASLAKCVEADRVSLLVRDEDGLLRPVYTYGIRGAVDESCRGFCSGEGVAGWCVESCSTANLEDPRMDPRFVARDRNDIDSMLCCPLTPREGSTLGAICAVNKHDGDNGGSHFDERDVRLMEGAARTLAQALEVRDNRTKQLSREAIKSMLSARSA